MKVSVIMAAYNGEKYIAQQIDSILPQLKETDELIISDDNSTDRTKEVIKGYLDTRIKFVSNERRGVISNFNNAALYASGDLIFLCDQDDVWTVNKIEVYKSKVNLSVPQLLISNFQVVDENLNPLGVEHIFKRGYLKNLVKNTYVGAMMCLNRKLYDIVFPVPVDIPMHDIFISLLSEKLKFNIKYIDEKLVLYRRHGNNVTGYVKNSLAKKVKMRLRTAKIVAKYIKTYKEMWNGAS